MEPCLQLKQSNCKNCYKCIRQCPVKSIKIQDQHAFIVPDECILCGACYVCCPQNAKEIRNDVHTAKELIASGRPVYASIAPSFVANYYGVSIASIEGALKKLGFAGAEETAIGATIVKREYEKIIMENKQEVIISTCCHSVNTLVQKYYPEALKYMAKVVTPMHAHCMHIKERYPDSYVVFIGPCISKKDEAEKYKSADCVLTFKELSQWLEEENIKIEEMPDLSEKGRARLFPTSGGIIRTMDMDNSYDYITIDGHENVLNALHDISSGKFHRCFIEMSICQGSCIGGPILNKQRHQPVTDYVAVNRFAGKDDFSVEQPEAGRLKKRISYESTGKTLPGEAAITEVLKKMGKYTKEQELNCGSCGYSTCRDKAIAVCQGKADVSMCLPYLIEKAESFSDTIIKNTPNGIIVLSEGLEIQQINVAACKILKIKNASTVIDQPVMTLLDPTDYFLAMNGGEKVTNKLRYLENYDKYVDETIIYDKSYHIIMTIMRDVTMEEKMKLTKKRQSEKAVEITDKVVQKHMRTVQEIASLLGETTAETKIALTKLKETLNDE